MILVSYEFFRLFFLSTSKIGALVTNVLFDDIGELLIVNPYFKIKSA